MARVFSFVLLLLISQSALTAVRLDQVNPNPVDAAPYLPASLRWHAQTFTPRITGTLDRVELSINCDPDSNGTVTIQIWKKNPPTGDWVFLDTATRPSAAMTGTGSDGWPLHWPFYFDTAPMTAGDSYLMHIGQVEAPCDFGISDQYADGEAGTFTIGGTFRDFGGLDDVFRTYVDDGLDTNPRLCVFDRWIPQTPRVPAHVPFCACVRNVDARALLCRFDLPELVLFRQIPFDQDFGEMNFAIMASEVLEHLQIRSFSADEFGFEAGEVEFQGLAPAKLQEQATGFQRKGPGEVTLEIELKGGSYRFITRDEWPKDPK